MSMTIKQDMVESRVVLRISVNDWLTDPSFFIVWSNLSRTLDLTMPSSNSLMSDSISVNLYRAGIWLSSIAI